MKRLMFLVLIFLTVGRYVPAQQSAADSPASKEDIQRYLEAVHSREMVNNMVDAMIKPMHQMLHEEYLKDKDKLPPDFETRTKRILDDYIKTFPWDQMMDSMIPVYQKHFTKGDVDSLVAFYQTPTGQKLLKEMPAIMTESMQTIMPLMRKQIETMNQLMQEEIAAMLRESSKNSKSAPQINN
jgi:hypothetical protein